MVGGDESCDTPTRSDSIDRDATVAICHWILNRSNNTMSLLSGMLVILGTGCVNPAKANSEVATHSTGEAGRRIVEYVKSQEGAGFRGAVLAAKNGKVVAAVGVGSSDLAGKSRITPSTLFEIASATKQFTAAAIMRLVQEGRLGLDDSIAKHLPGVPEECRAITVRHLLQHTSGIPGKNSQGGGKDLGKVLPLFLRGGPRHPPGTHWEYWNQGYALLSEIIARVSGEPYTDFCRRALFTPSGMHVTRFTGDTAYQSAPRGGRDTCALFNTNFEASSTFQIVL